MFRNTLEIGAHYGASTCAFVDAAEQRPDLRVWVCDMTIQETVRCLVQESTATSQIELLESPAITALTKLIERRIAIDIALLDGSHAWYEVALDAALLRCLGARSLLLHDVANVSQDQYGREYLFDGPRKLLEKYESSSSWLTILDKEARVGELTYRGIALVTRDRDIYEEAAEIFSAWASVAKDDLLRT